MVAGSVINMPTASQNTWQHIALLEDINPVREAGIFKCSAAGHMRASE